MAALAKPQKSRKHCRGVPKTAEKTQAKFASKLRDNNKHFANSSRSFSAWGPHSEEWHDRVTEGADPMAPRRPAESKRKETNEPARLTRSRRPRQPPPRRRRGRMAKCGTHNGQQLATLGNNGLQQTTPHRFYGLWNIGHSRCPRNVRKQETNDPYTMFSDYVPSSPFQCWLKPSRPTQLLTKPVTCTSTTSYSSNVRQPLILMIAPLSRSFLVIEHNWVA